MDPDKDGQRSREQKPGGSCGTWTLSLSVGVRSNPPLAAQTAVFLVPKGGTTDPQAHKQLQFDTLLELGSVHALQVETMLKAIVDRTRLCCNWVNGFVSSVHVFLAHPSVWFLAILLW